MWEDVPLPDTERYTLVWESKVWCQSHMQRPYVNSMMSLARRAKAFAYARVDCLHICTSAMSTAMSGTTTK